MPNKVVGREPDWTADVVRPRTMRRANLGAVFALFRQRRALSRAELARLTGLTKATTSVIVDTLANLGYVRAAGVARGTGGRPPEIFELVPTARYVLGAELGDTRCVVALTDLDGRACRVLTGPSSSQADQALAALEALIAELLVETPIASIVGLGVGVPGIVDTHDGRIEVAPDLGWREVAVGPTLSSRFELPATVVNRAKAAALGEYASRSGRSCDPLIFISVSTGIAAGIVANGQLFRGATMHDGELGHVTVVPDGPRCACGNRGCLQALAASAGLLSDVRERLRQAPPSPLLDAIYHRSDAEALQAVGASASAGDPVALAAVEAASEYIGLATANLVNVLNPRTVVFGGMVPRAIPLLLDRIREHVRRRGAAPALTGLEIAPATLGDEAVAIGAATLVLGDGALTARLFDRLDTLDLDDGRPALGGTLAG